MQDGVPTHPQKAVCVQDPHGELRRGVAEGRGPVVRLHRSRQVHGHDARDTVLVHATNRVSGVCDRQSVGGTGGASKDGEWEQGEARKRATSLKQGTTPDAIASQVQYCAPCSPRTGSIQEGRVVEEPERCLQVWIRVAVPVAAATE